MNRKWQMVNLSSLPHFFCQNASLSKKKSRWQPFPPLPSVLHLVDTRTVALPHTRQCNVIQWNARQCSVAKCTHGNSPSWTSFCYKRRLQNPQFMEGFFLPKKQKPKKSLRVYVTPRISIPQNGHFLGVCFLNLFAPIASKWTLGFFGPSENLQTLKSPIRAIRFFFYFSFFGQKNQFSQNYLIGRWSDEPTHIYLKKWLKQIILYF